MSRLPKNRNTAERRNRVVDFLTLPRARAWRHVVLVGAFTLISLGQMLFMLGGRTGNPGAWFWVAETMVAALLVGYSYVNLRVLVPRLLLRGRYVEYGLALAGGTLAYVVVKWVAESWLLGRAGVETEFNAVTVLDWLSTTVMFAVCLSATSAVVLFRGWIDQGRKISEMESRGLRSSVESIRGRVDPPWLFRTLDHAAELVKNNPRAASEVIFGLSERLRKALYGPREQETTRPDGRDDINNPNDEVRR